MKINPANVEELAQIAREIGADVLRGHLRYPGSSGSWELDGISLSEHLEQYWDQEVTIIVAATSEAEPETFMCGICGFVMNEVGECPRCKYINQLTAAAMRAQPEEIAALLEEAREILESGRDVA
jgi:hypothetical protein